MNLDKLDESEKFIWKWQYFMLDDFKIALILAIKKADNDNREKLRLGFPDEVDGYINFTETLGWWTKVELKVGK